MNLYDLYSMHIIGLELLEPLFQALVEVKIICGLVTYSHSAASLPHRQRYKPIDTLLLLP